MWVGLQLGRFTRTPAERRGSHVCCPALEQGERQEAAHVHAALAMSPGWHRRRSMHGAALSNAVVPALPACREAGDRHVKQLPGPGGT